MAGNRNSGRKRVDNNRTRLVKGRERFHVQEDVTLNEEPIGKPPKQYTPKSSQKKVWASTIKEMPWLRLSHRGLLELLCVSKSILLDLEAKMRVENTTALQKEWRLLSSKVLDIEKALLATKPTQAEWEALNVIPQQKDDDPYVTTI